MSGMIPGMEPQVATQPAIRVTFNQVEAILKDVPVDLLPEVYEYLASLVASSADARAPNELTRQVFADTDAGRNLNRYQTVEELFETLRVNASED